MILEVIKKQTFTLSPSSILYIFLGLKHGFF